MPYGIDKDLGGDTEETDSSMESCVEDLMKQGHSKESAIKICKASIQGKLRKNKSHKMLSRIRAKGKEGG